MNEQHEDIETRLQAVLEEAFSAGAGLYNRRGFKRRVGYGTRPAIIHIDMANAWTRPGNPFTCYGIEPIISAIQDVNTAARAKGVPILYTTTAYDVNDPAEPNDMGLWYSKIPVEVLKVGDEAVEIDSRIAPEGNDIVLTKKRASAFPGTNLNLFLTSNRIDTLIVTGCTAAGCVRHTVEDAMAEGFRPIIVKEAVGDRVPGVVQWNLFDMDAKFGDVEPLANVVDYLNSLPHFSETVPTPLGDPIPAPAQADEVVELV